MFDNFEKIRIVSQLAEEDKYPDKIKPYIRQANDFIANYKGYFDIIGGSNKTPEYVLDDDLKETNYWYECTRNQIGISLKSFVDMKTNNLKEPQILFSVGHELGHFNDMRDDPRAYVDNFSKHERKAEEMAPEVMEIWRQRGLSLPAWLTEKQVANQFIRKQYRELYNVLDDIYVNRHNLRAMPRFSGEFNGFNSEVRDMYADYLFPNKGKEKGLRVDYSQLPRVKQFSYYILRQFMVPDEEIIISQEVKDVIHGYLSEIDRKVNNDVFQAIQDMAKPSSAYDKSQHQAGFRYEWIEKWIEPLFKKMFLKDVQDMPLPTFEEQDKQSKQGKDKDENDQGGEQKDKGKQDGDQGEEGQGQPKNQPNVWKDIIDPGSISKEVVKKYLDDKRKIDQDERIKERKKNKEAQVSPEERIKQQQREHDYMTAKENNLSKQDVKTYNNLLDSIEPYKNKLAETFQKIMENIEERIVMAWENGWHNGKFNIDDFIEKYGSFIVAERYEAVPWNKLDVYDRQEFTKKLSLFPNKIRLRLIIDNSGSMQDKLIETKRLMILLMESLKVFESEVNQRFRLSEEFYVDTQVISFASGPRIIKPFDSENLEADKQIARWRAVAEIDASGASTNNSGAWKKIINSIDYEESLKKDEAMEFCFEITDGGVDNYDIAKRSREIIDKLEDMKVNVAGFLIGNFNQDDQNKFDSIWNEADVDRGFIISNLEDLAEVISERFVKIIEDKQIRIATEGGYIEEDEF